MSHPLKKKSQFRSHGGKQSEKFSQASLRPASYISHFPVPIIFKCPGSQGTFPSPVPHCVTKPVKWGTCSSSDTSAVTHGAPLLGRIVQLRQLRDRAGVSTKHQAATRASKGPR